MSKKKSSAFLHIVTPFIVLLICSGVLAVALIKPYDKAKVYLNLAFMDDLKLSPQNKSSGLTIKQNEIQTDYSGETSETGEVIHPSFAEQFAVISSDRFSLDVPVYWGSGNELLELGACQAVYSALPGTEGHSVISAHADTFFSELTELKEGDTVKINTQYGEFVYTVKELITFTKTQNKYVAPSKDTKLTLYTCKKDVLGSSDERIGAVCELTQKKFYKEVQ